MQHPTVSQSKEDYLAAIYRLTERQGRATTSEVARLLGVSSASTTHMFKKLAAEGLVDYKEYSGASLTPEGWKVAAPVIRRHRLTERFLVDVLGFGWDEVDTIADQMEHALPDVVIDRIDVLLGHPVSCPHGHPIPRPDGTLVQIPLRSLASLEPNRRAVIARVDETDPEMLRYLASCRLVPGQEVEVVSVRPVDGVISLRVDGQDVVVGQRIAQAVCVADPDAAG